VLVAIFVIGDHRLKIEDDSIEHIDVETYIQLSNMEVVSSTATKNEIAGALTDLFRNINELNDNDGDGRTRLNHISRGVNSLNKYASHKDIGGGESVDIDEEREKEAGVNAEVVIDRGVECLRENAERRPVSAIIKFQEVTKKLLECDANKRKHEKASSRMLRQAVKRGLKSMRMGAYESIEGYLLVTDVNVRHGHGVVADRAFSVGDPIMMCTGELRVSSALAKHEYDEYMCYSLDEAGAEYVDLNVDTGSAKYSNMVCFVNTAKSPGAVRDRSGGGGQNAEICYENHAPVPILYATRDIHVGEEILSGYEITDA
jgi:hypothetical protein